MDIFLPIVLVIVFFILFSICGWCCKRKHQGVVLGQSGTPITISNQPVNASPVVIPPYPMDQAMPQSQMPGFVPTYQGGYPMPQPQPQMPGFQPGYGAGYPPGPPAPGFFCPPGYGNPMGGPYTEVYPPPQGAPTTAPPPSYHEAVAHPPPPSNAHVVNEGYAKQAPYNPNF